MSVSEAAEQLDQLTLKHKRPSRESEKEEEILRENTRRFCLFPIKYHEVSSNSNTCLHSG
jgi:ribonucleoside-diphosphate reductase subunit M2